MKCENCGSELVNHQKYCQNCGARIIKNRLTLKNLIAQAGEEFFNYDNKILKTLKHLITQPEAVIDGYIDGTRKKYMNPISFTTIAIALYGIQTYILRTFYPEYIEKLNNAVPEEQLEEFSNLINTLTDNQDLLLFAMMPLMALISYIVFWNLKKYNFIEHVVVHFYCLPLTSILGTLITPFILLFPNNNANINIMAIFSYAVMLIYYTYVFKSIFSLNAKRITIKTLIFIGLLGSIFIAIIVVGIIIGIILSMMGVIEAPQP